MKRHSTTTSLIYLKEDSGGHNKDDDDDDEKGMNGEDHDSDFVQSQKGKETSYKNYLSKETIKTS